MGYLDERASKPRSRMVVRVSVKVGAPGSIAVHPSRGVLLRV